VIQQHIRCSDAHSVILYTYPARLAKGATAHPDVVSGGMQGRVLEVHGLRALRDEVLGGIVNDTAAISTRRIGLYESRPAPHLNMALWAPVRHTTNWQKAVRALSGHAILSGMGLVSAPSRGGFGW
jgi:hypothetical protein